MSSIHAFSRHAPFVRIQLQKIRYTENEGQIKQVPSEVGFRKTTSSTGDVQVKHHLSKGGKIISNPRQEELS